MSVPATACTVAPAALVMTLLPVARAAVGTKGSPPRARPTTPVAFSSERRSNPRDEVVGIKSLPSVVTKSDLLTTLSDHTRENVKSKQFEKIDCSTLFVPARRWLRFRTAGSRNGHPVSARIRARHLRSIPDAVVRNGLSQVAPSAPRPSGGELRDVVSWCWVSTGQGSWWLAAVKLAASTP